LLKIIRRLFGRQADGSSIDSPRENDYRAVTITPAKGSCPQAVRIRGKSFLLKEAPRLPLPSCAHPASCACRYRKHPDRRIRDRRDVFASSRWYNGTERRRSGGRRASDKIHTRIDLQ
jgi:hypothetical protein